MESWSNGAGYLDDCIVSRGWVSRADEPVQTGSTDTAIFFTD